jgi:hypothetical protein
MRHTTATLLATLLLAGAATGCGSSSDKPAAKPSPTVDKAGQYLKTAHGIKYNGHPSDEELLALPSKWCKALDAGHSVKWMFDSTGGGGLYPWGADWGTAQVDADGLLVAGVRLYCPANSAAVREELRTSGEY